MRHRKILTLVLAVMLVASLVLTGCAKPVPSKVINWNYHTAYHAGYYNGGSHLETWSKMVEDKTNGQLKINIFYSSGLGYKGPEVMSSLRDGLLDSGELAVALYAPEVAPWWSFGDFYSMYDNVQQVEYVLDIAKPMFEEDIRNFGGVIPLAIFNCCPYSSFEGIWMNKEIKEWGDFKGTKIRIFFTLARKYCFDPLGFETLFLPGPETYEGLKTGLVDGAIQSPSAGYFGHYYEVAKYFYSFEPITFSPWGYLCSEKSFNALPKDVQEGLLEASREMEDYIENKVWPNQSDYCPGCGGEVSEEYAVKHFQDHGITIVRMPKLREMVVQQNLIGMQEWAAEAGPRAQKMVDAIIEAREKYPGLDNPLYENLPVWEIE